MTKSNLLPQEQYSELKWIRKRYPKKVAKWFEWFQGEEIIGWRPKAVRKKIADLLDSGRPIQLFALFCPSYKKGKGAFGFRTDDIGSGTKAGIEALLRVYQGTKKLDFKIKRPLAIFFDLAVERPEKTLVMLDDLDKNAANLEKSLPKEFAFARLSTIGPLLEIIGWAGIKIDPPPIPEKTFKRVVERGTKFYKLFGWTKAMIKERSLVIASSEAIVGHFLKAMFPLGILVYTASMLERASVYSGRNWEGNPLPVIFPKLGAVVI